MTNLMMVMILSFLFGMAQKLADAADEHGVRLFRGGNVLSGVVCGILGSMLISLDTGIAVYYTALLCYWLIGDKIDFLNHQLAAVIMLSWMIFHLELSSGHFWAFSVVLVLFVCSGIVDDYLKSKLRGRLSVRLLRIRFCIVALIASFIMADYAIPLSTLCAMMGVEATDLLVRKSSSYVESPN